MEDKMKFSTGEWIAKEGQIYSEKTGKTIAIIPYFDNEEEQIANANLMSSAPELFEISLALWKMLQFYVKNYPSTPTTKLLLDYAERTIRKSYEIEYPIKSTYHLK